MYNKEKAKVYRAKTKAKRFEYNKLWREKNKEYNLARKTKYRRDNKERIALYDKDYRKKNQRHRTLLSIRYHQISRDAEGSHTSEEFEEMKKFYNYMCLCCKKFEPEIKLGEDHIIPLSKSGTNYIENIQPLCGSCNSIKNVKIIDFKLQFANPVQS